MKVAELTPEAVINKAHAAAMEVKSFHFSMSMTVTGRDEGKWSIDADFLSPDRMNMVIEGDGTQHEVRCIGDKVYERDLYL